MIENKKMDDLLDGKFNPESRYQLTLETGKNKQRWSITGKLTVKKESSVSFPKGFLRVDIDGHLKYMLLFPNDKIISVRER